MFREKIKDFLAAQGMIKGHSGSGTRTSEQEGMLVLINDHGRSDTSSPHSPALSVDSSDDHRRPNGHNVSSLRHDPHYPSISLSAQHSHGYSSQRMSFSSARESSPLNLPRLPSAYHHPLPDMADARETMNSELILPFSPPPTSSNILPQPPTSLVSPMSQSCKNPYRY
jgi:C6 transcription factor Pro1